MKQIVAFSGGNDSTAMVLRMAESGEDFECLFTPAGNEPAELFAHVRAVIEMIQRPLVQPPNLSLMFLILKYNALPNCDVDVQPSMFERERYERCRVCQG